MALRATNPLQYKASDQACPHTSITCFRRGFRSNLPPRLSTPGARSTSRTSPLGSILHRSPAFPVTTSSTALGLMLGQDFSPSMNLAPTHEMNSWNTPCAFRSTSASTGKAPIGTSDGGGPAHREAPWRQNGNCAPREKVEKAAKRGL